MEETPVDRDDWQQRTLRQKNREKWAPLLLLLAWLLLNGLYISSCVVCKPDGQIVTVGRIILGLILGPFFGTLLAAVVWCSRRAYLDFDCPRCGRPFYSTDLPIMLRTGLCPECGQPIAREDLESLE